MDKHKIAEILRQNLQWVVDQELVNTHFEERLERHREKHSMMACHKLEVTLDPNANHNNHLKATSYMLIMGEKEARELIRMVESL